MPGRPSASSPARTGDRRSRSGPAGIRAQDEARQALTGRAGVLAVKDHEGSAGASAAPGAPAVLDVDFSGDDAGVSALLQDLVGRGVPVLHFSESVHDLEDVFMQATKGIVS